MPELVQREWMSPSGKPRPYQAFVPDPLAGLDFSIDASVFGRVDAATRALAAAGARHFHASPSITRLLLRAEGIASSEIEQIRTSVDRLALADLGQKDETTSWVTANIETIESAVRLEGDLTVDAILHWHRALMTGSRLDGAFVGAFRAVQNWVGGSEPSTAAFVPPPPEYVHTLMDDLVSFANRTDLPGVIQAGILHAQFETIHPFADGNGRVGRALIGWCLSRRGLAESALPPLSPILVRQAGAYIAGLYDYREGRLDRWVGWFADASGAAAQHLIQLAEGVETVLSGWQRDTEDLRSDSAAVRSLPLLAERAAVDTRLVAESLGVSLITARAGMNELERRGIVDRVAVTTGEPGRPPIAWVASRIVALLT